MPTMTLVKTMPRELTAEEKQKCQAFIRDHETMDVADLISEFETQIGIPITKTCVHKLMLDMILNDGFEI